MSTYLNVAEVETAVVNLASAYPSLCQLITLPNTTVEGRTSHALLLGGGAPGSRDCVMIIGGQHAKEWGSCEIILNLAVDLIEAFETNTGRAYGGKVFSASQIQQIMNGLHVIVFPLVNPDGRKFSQDHIASHAPAGLAAQPQSRVRRRQLQLRRRRPEPQLRLPVRLQHGVRALELPGDGRSLQ